MKNFIKYISTIVVVFFLFLIVADCGFTYVFYKCTPRNKFQHVFKNENKKYNSVFLGSSRIANHIDITYLDSLSGLKNINLGVEGANYADNLLILKVLLENNNKVEKLYLQLDHFYENDEMSTVANTDALPFIRNEIVQNHFKKYDNNYLNYYYLPFYRYLSADFKIGFREFFMSLINKEPRIDLNNGFIPKFKNNNTLTAEILPLKTTKTNFHVEEIISLCKKNDIDLILFCAPFCSLIKNGDYVNSLKEKYPKLNDYSKVMGDDYFYNCSHLNDKGAKKFTYLIFKNHFNN